MGIYAEDGVSPGRLPGQGCKASDREAAPSGEGQKWFYPSLAGALKEADVVRVRTLILRRQNTVAQFIATRPILGLCEVAERRRGARVPRRWWEQTVIDWKLAREKAEAQEGENEAELELTGSELDSDPETTPGGTAGGTGGEASLGAP